MEEASIYDIHRAMQSGGLTARQLVDMYLKRIEAYDKKGPLINAVITINPKALELADVFDARFKTSGLIGPLHGIPLLVKDNIGTSDMPTSAGSLSLKGFVPPEDAFIVKRLKQSGAIILAKVNQDDFAFGSQTVSSILGQTLNPYDLTRTPGGSSGGTGAGIAANFGAAGIGTDTGNSIRLPASSNNIVGMRPTLGAVSRTGIIPNSSSQDTAGPMVRTVTDAAILLDVITGYDPEDHVTARGVGNVPQTYKSFLDKNGLEGSRLGVLKSFFGIKKEHQEINDAIEKAIETMKTHGAIIITLDEQINRKKVGRVNVTRYESQGALNRYLEKMGSKAPAKSMEAIIASGKYHEKIEEGLKNRQQLSEQDHAYKERLVKRIELQDNFLKIMADHQLDAIIYPHATNLVAKTGHSATGCNGTYTAIMGFPSIAVPTGFSTPTDEAPLGVPIGMEFAGRPWSDPILIKLAYSFEQATKWRRPPLSTPALDG